MWNKPLPESSPLPLWFQIADRLRDAIAEGVFAPGDAMPSEAKLNEIFGISRATSRTALDRLEQEGLISRKSGKGSIVRSPRVDQPADEMLGFGDDMRRRGLRPSYETHFAGRLRASAEVAEALNVGVGVRVFHSRRLLKADERPMGIALSWLSPKIVGKVADPTVAELTEGSLYEWLKQKCGATVAGAKEYIEAAILDDQMAADLQTAPGAPMLIVRRRSYAEDGSPIEYAVLNFRSDRYRLHLEAGKIPRA
ncbi:MAG TPA: GntR family transcriptional regulator [Roseiarcus sp.]|jgi:GntR family transcriptional regulator